MLRSSLGRSLVPVRFHSAAVSESIGARYTQSMMESNKSAEPLASPSQIALKVGLIKECQKHPDADKLYVSSISISKEDDEKPELLTVCSGLVDYVPRETLLHKKVVLVTNLKPSKMRGIKSEAMLLAADRTAQERSLEVEVVNAPVGSEPGDELSFEGFPVPEGAPARLKPKVWEELQRQLGTNTEGAVVFRDEHGLDHVLVREGAPAYVTRLTGCSVR